MIQSLLRLVPCKPCSRLFSKNDFFSKAHRQLISLTKTKKALSSLVSIQVTVEQKLYPPDGEGKEGMRESKSEQNCIQLGGSAPLCLKICHPPSMFPYILRMFYSDIYCTSSEGNNMRLLINVTTHLLCIQNWTETRDSQSNSYSCFFLGGGDL